MMDEGSSKSSHSRNYFNYFTEIEEHFVRRRGKNLMVSPLDWCLIELWKNRGVPQHIVIRGIDRSFEAALKLHKTPPRTLFYCHPAVMEAFEQYEEAMVGSHQRDAEPSGWTEELSRDRAAAHLRLLQKQMEKREGEVFRRAVRHLSSLRSELRSHTELRPEEIERALTNLAAAMAGQLLQELPRQRILELKRSVRAEMRIYKKRLKKETYQRLEKSYLERRVRQEFRVPEITLFQLQNSLE